MPFEFFTMSDEFRPVRRACWPGCDDERCDGYDWDAADGTGDGAGTAEPVSAADVLDDPESVPF